MVELEPCIFLLNLVSIIAVSVWIYRSSNTVWQNICHLTVFVLILQGTTAGEVVWQSGFSSVRRDFGIPTVRATGCPPRWSADGPGHWGAELPVCNPATSCGVLRPPEGKLPSITPLKLSVSDVNSVALSSLCPAR